MSKLIKSFETPFFYESKKQKVNIVIKGFVYFNEDTYDPSFEDECINYDIDSINLLGGKDNIRDLLHILEGGWIASDIEREVKRVGLELFERELRPLRQDDNDDELDLYREYKENN